MDKTTAQNLPIGACGLYCGACRKLLNEQCAGCQPQEDNQGIGQSLPKGFQRCKIRKCCKELGFRTCAECHKDVKKCNTHNNFIGKVFALIFRSDRAACIRYIRDNGEQAYAEEMARRGQQTMKRK